MQSNYHYSNLTLDGDLPRMAAPFRWYEDVRNDPIGWQAITQKKEYPGAARFTTHESVIQWFDKGYAVVNAVVKDKVHSIYYTSTALVMGTHLLFIFLAFQYAKGAEKFSYRKFAIIGLLASVMIQYNGFYDCIGIIDRSISYVFCYALPVLLLLIYFLPFYKNEVSQNYSVKTWQNILMIPAAALLSFSSVLIQPIIFIFFILYIGGVFIKNPFFSIKKNKSLLLQILFFIVCCLYAFYVSRFNSESSLYKPLAERYFLLLKGFFRIMTIKLAWSYLLLFTVINCWIILRTKTLSWQQLKPIIYFVLAFCAIYILLLPLGGYRSYREYIIRYDTFIPVTLGVCFLLFFTTYKIFWALKNTSWKIYTVGLLLFIGIFLWADRDVERQANYCQQGQLYEMQNSRDTIIQLPYRCNMMMWSKDDIYGKEHMQGINICLRRWGIIEAHQRVTFYEK